MKRIKVTFNAKNNPVKFPADIKYFSASDTDKIGEKTADRIFHTWAEKNNLVVLRIEIVPVDGSVITPDMQKITEL